ncbi:hypothetical protein C8Q76DRAFT_706774 [Earliella scabrosa]|nr:hypothetical protein C8Q76DRAFT_706774 [Earliella scabrosa]
MITSTAANMASIVIECTLFGMFLLLSSFSLIILVHRQTNPSHNPHSGALDHIKDARTRWRAVVPLLTKSPLVLANVLFMLMATANWVIGIRRLFVGIVTLGGGQAAIEYYQNLPEPTEVARGALLFGAVLLGDVIMTYRTWLVWERNYQVLLVPFMTNSILVGCGIGMLHDFAMARPDKSVFAADFGRWITGYCTATLCTNLYGTSMISYRICATNRATNRLLRANDIKAEGRHLTGAMAILVESAAMYSAWAISFVILYATGSTLQTVIAGCGPAAIGITFMLITVRAALGWGPNSRPLALDSTRVDSSEDLALTAVRDRV